MNDHLSIRVRAKFMTSTLQLFAQIEKVVDLAVEHHGHAAIFVVDGLGAASEIDDAEPAHSQAHVASRVNAFIIRTAVHEGVRHAPHLLGRNLLARAGDHSGYSAHRCTSKLSSFSDVSRTAAGTKAGLRPDTEIGCRITRRSSRPQSSNQRKTSS